MKFLQVTLTIATNRSDDEFRVGLRLANRIIFQVARGRGRADTYAISIRDRISRDKIVFNEPCPVTAARHISLRDRERNRRAD